MQPEQNNQPYNSAAQQATTDATTPTVLGEAQTIDAQNPEAASVINQSWPEHKEHAVQPWRRYVAIGLACLLLVAGLVLLLRLSSKSITTTKAGDFGVLDVPLERFAPLEEAQGEQVLEVNGQLQVGDSIVISPGVQPSQPVAGQLYYDETTNQLAYYNGTAFVVAGGNVIQNTFNSVGSGGGGGEITGGTANRLVKFTGASSVGNSIVADQDSYIQVTGGVNVVPSVQSQSFNFWPDNDVPAIPNAIDIPPVELGVKFNTDVSGFINGIRFYRGTTSLGPYTASLWTNNGILLARKTFTVSGFGWQSVTFDSPVAISSDTTYIASYHNGGGGGYAVSTEYFGSGVNNGPLHALASGLDGFNGVFKYNATSTFPSQGFQSSNYWIDVSFTGSTFTLESRYRVNGAQISSGDLANNTDLAKRSSAQVFSGHNIFRNSSDSFSAFDIQQADTTQLFSVNTTDGIIYIGPNDESSPGVLLVLGRRTATGDPVGVDGAVYYNVDMQAFRCFRFGEWADCGNITPSSSFSAYDDFLGGTTTSFVDPIGNMGWTAQAIGANGTLSFNPSTPTPVADRPGVLALQTPAVSNQGTTLTLSSSSGGSHIISKDNLIKTSVAVGAATGQVLRVGLHNQTTGTAQPVSGIWWEADPATSANWRYCYGDGTTATCANTAVAIAANTWVRLELRVRTTGTGTSAATYYINSTNPIFVNNVTIDSTNRVSPAFSCFGTSGAAQNCYWDYFQFRGTTSAPR